MNTYNFDTEVAIKYGVDAAIIINTLRYWLEKNVANNRNVHDGEVWTYNSLEAWTKLFPFWTRRQIEARLNDMHEKGIISKGNYNKHKFDRTVWYTLKSPELRISPNCDMQKTETGNADPQDVTTIPINKPILKTINNAFDEFWKLYPRKVNKKAAQRIFNRLSDEKKKKAIAGIKDRFNGTDPQFILYPSTYLNGERWCDEITAPKPVQSMMI